MTSVIFSLHAFRSVINKYFSWRPSHTGAVPLGTSVPSSWLSEANRDRAAPILSPLSEDLCAVKEIVYLPFEDNYHWQENSKSKICLIFSTQIFLHPLSISFHCPDGHMPIWWLLAQCEGIPTITNEKLPKIANH